VDRRFQFKGAAAGVSVIDDYGHHPTEIRATLSAARQCGFRRVHVIFQPHRFTRTRDLMDEFATAFADADTLCLLDIYPASEKRSRASPRWLLPAALPEQEGERRVRPFLFGRCFLRRGTCPTRRHDSDARRSSVSQLGAMIVEKLDGANQLGTVSNRENKL